MKKNAHRVLMSRPSSVIYLLLGASIFLYAYFLSLTFAHTVEARALTMEITSVKGNLGTLERQYVSSVSSLTPDSAPKEGLTLLGEPSHLRVLGPVAANVSE